MNKENKPTHDGLNKPTHDGLDAFYIGKPKIARVLETRVANSPRIKDEEYYDPVEAQAEFEERLKNASINTDYVPSYPIRTPNELNDDVAINAAYEIEKETQRQKIRDRILRQQEEEEISKTWIPTHRAGRKTKKRRKHKRTTQKRKKARKTKRSKR
jgi:hypothetical protein